MVLPSLHRPWPLLPPREVKAGVAMRLTCSTGSSRAARCGGNSWDDGVGRPFRFSSPPGLAGPAAHETLLFCGCVVGTEVGILLVRLSPSFSWTRGSLSTSDCRHGPSSAPEHTS